MKGAAGTPLTLNTLDPLDCYYGALPAFSLSIGRAQDGAPCAAVSFFDLAGVQLAAGGVASAFPAGIIEEIRDDELDCQHRGVAV